MNTHRMREEEHERELESMRMMMFAKSECSSIAEEKAVLEQARKQLQVRLRVCSSCMRVHILPVCDSMLCLPVIKTFRHMDVNACTH